MTVKLQLRASSVVKGCTPGFMWPASRMTAGDGRLRANRFSCLSESTFCHSPAWLRLHNCSKWRMEVLALPSENFFSALSGPLISSNSILNLCRFFFWVDVKFFFFLFKFRVLGGLFYYYFLNFSKGKKVLFRACSKVAIFLMRSTSLPPT